MQKFEFNELTMTLKITNLNSANAMGYSADFGGSFPYFDGEKKSPLFDTFKEVKFDKSFLQLMKHSKQDYLDIIAREFPEHLAKCVENGGVKGKKGFAKFTT
jgi:hypothetical protein